MLNVSILQTMTWLAAIALCIVCMFQTVTAALAAILIFLFSRTMLVAGCQAVITTTLIFIENLFFNLEFFLFISIDFHLNLLVLFLE
jgi:hypothetical protein